MAAAPTPNEPTSSGGVDAEKQAAVENTANTSSNKAEGKQQEHQKQQDAPQDDGAVPTYQSVQEKEIYKKAKTLLNEDAFEEALQTIEQAIQETTQTLQSKGTTNADVELHESLAPLHYLYGTTLLYSLEESTTEAMTTVEEQMAAAIAGATANDTNDDQGGDDDGGNDKDEDSRNEQEGAPASNANDDDQGGGDDGGNGKEENNPNEQAPASNANDAEDLQIAWENLDIARKIVQDLMQQPNNNDEEQLNLDLAQIHLRLGDLQRINGRYDSAIDDYRKCLILRQGRLDDYSRKIADVHYNLALTYQNAEALQKEQETVGSTADSQQQYRAKSLHHYVECAKALSGQLALLCNAKPHDIVESLPNTDDDSDKASSAQIQVLRKRVGSLTSNDQAVHDIKELLDEIQETVDDVDNARKGVQEISAIKAQAQQAAEGEGGFDAPSAAVSQAANVSSNAAPQQPMMVIRKKKKRDSSLDGKPASTKETANKRAKTTE